MKLYYSPGACSLSPHIALMEAGLPFTTEKVDLRSKQTETGADFTKINSKGAVPALLLDDQQVLTEGAAIVQYIADLKPESGLAPKAGSFERYRLIELLNYLAAEVHKAFGPLFNPASSSDVKATAIANLGTRFDWLSKYLGAKPYLLGETFTVADGYLFAMLSWCSKLHVDLSKWPALVAYHARVAQRPKVQATLRAEGLLN
jgi:glutathione S-transferase